MLVCEDPPRPAEGSQLATEMAGYMAGRGDFMTEHENYMELDLRSVRFDAEDEPVESGTIFMTKTFLLNQSFLLAKKI